MEPLKGLDVGQKYEIGRKINAFAFPRICFAFPGETLGSR